MDKKVDRAVALMALLLAAASLMALAGCCRATADAGGREVPIVYDRRAE